MPEALATAAEIVARAGESISPERARLIEDAYSFAAACHQDQRRESGDPYFVHPVAAALTVASLNLDGAAIAAALLHDVVEDCGVANADIVQRFGEDVAHLVEGVTKLSRLSRLRPEDAAWDEGVQADNLRTCARWTRCRRPSSSALPARRWISTRR
jgi:GTP pyrophosphokinase